jgi:Leucine-rich repeat (LRR) protein
MTKAREKALVQQVLPAIQAALLELGEEARLQEVEQLDPIEVDPVSFVAALLRRKNPKRAERALQRALAAAQRDKEEGIAAEAQSAPPPAAVALPPQPMPEGVASADLSAAEAAAVADALAAGGVISARTGLPLLRREGDFLHVLCLGLSPPVDEHAMLRAELDATRDRAHRASPPMMGSRPSFVPPPPPVTGTHKVPLGQVREWLQAGNWTDHGLPALLATELRATFVSHTPVAASHLRPVPLGGGALSFARFTSPHEGVTQMAIAALQQDGVITALHNLPAALLSSPLFCDVMAASRGVSLVGVAPLQTGAAWRGLASACEGLANLETLELRGQQLSTADAAALFTALAKTRLRCLDMTGTTHAAAEPPPAAGGYGASPAELTPPEPVGSAADASAALALAMNPLLSSGCIERLRLPRSALGDDGGVLVLVSARGVPVRNPLQELDVSGNGLGASAGVALAELVTSASRLHTLRLSDNPLFVYPAEALGAVAEAVGKSDSLTSLEWRREAADLGVSSMGRKARCAWGVAVARMLRTNTSLTHLDLAGHPLASSRPGDDPQSPHALQAAHVAAALGHAAAAHWRLRSLCLAGVRLPDGCLAALLAPLAAHPALSALDVSGNNLGPLAAAALAEVLNRKSRLATLTARECGLNHDGLSELVPPLRYNTTLTSLDLMGNALGGDGYVSELSAYQEAPALVAAAALAELLECNTTLTTLRFARCGLHQPMSPAPEHPHVEKEANGGDGDAGAEAEPPSGQEGAQEAPGEEGAGRAQEGEEELVGALLGRGLQRAFRSALESLDLSGNRLGDAGVAALARGLPHAPKLRSLRLAGCASEVAHLAVSEAIAAGGSVVLCDLLDHPLTPANAPPGRATASAPSAGAATAGSLQAALCSNRWDAAMLWGELAHLFPPAAAAAAAFCGLPGATADAAPLIELTSRLLPPLALARLNSWPASTSLPYGGFVQWVGDFFCGTWDASEGRDAPFALLMRAMAQPHALRSTADDPPSSHVEIAAAALLRERRRYFQPPPPKPREPAAAASLCESAVSCLDTFVSALNPLEAAAKAPGAAAIGDAAAAAVGSMLAPRGTAANAHEPLHVALPPELSTHEYRDVIDKTYRLELQGMLRVDGPGAPVGLEHAPPQLEPLPHGGAVLAAGRCQFDDWDFLYDEAKPQPWREWLHCLRWLSKGHASAMCLPETDAAGEPTTRYEVMVQRPFSAGTLRCALSATQNTEEAQAADAATAERAEAAAALAEARLGIPDGEVEPEEGPVAEAKARCDAAAVAVASTKLRWKLSALHVHISPTFVPSGPLATWHDAEPFGPEPEPEPEAEPEAPPPPPPKGKKK